MSRWSMVYRMLLASITYILFSQIIDTEPVPIRLVGGSSENEGRVEIYFNNTWGTVCDDGWDAADAEVVCRQLGLPFNNARYVKKAEFGQGTGQIWLDDVACEGSESSLDGCLSTNQQWGRHNCNHGEDAGVICTNGNIFKLVHC